MDPILQKGLNLAAQIKDRTVGPPITRETLLAELQSRGYFMAYNPPEIWLDYTRFLSALYPSQPYLADEEDWEKFQETYQMRGAMLYPLEEHPQGWAVGFDLNSQKVYEFDEFNQAEEKGGLAQYGAAICERLYADFERRFANRKQLSERIDEALAQLKKLFINVQAIIPQLAEKEETEQISLSLAQVCNTFIREPYLERYQPDFFYWYEKAWQQTEALSYWLELLALRNQPMEASLQTAIFQSVIDCSKLKQLAKAAYLAPDASVAKPSPTAIAEFNLMIKERP